MLNRKLILHPSFNFMLHHVLLSFLTRLRLKFIKTWILHLKWFPRDYRAAVHEENWANHPFKRKLYLWHAIIDLFLFWAVSSVSLCIAIIYFFILSCSNCVSLLFMPCHYWFFLFWAALSVSLLFMSFNYWFFILSCLICIFIVYGKQLLIFFILSCLICIFIVNDIN